MRQKIHISPKILKQFLHSTSVETSTGIAVVIKTCCCDTTFCIQRFSLYVSKTAGVSTISMTGFTPGNERNQLYVVVAVKTTMNILSLRHPQIGRQNRNMRIYIYCTCITHRHPTTIGFFCTDCLLVLLLIHNAGKAH